MIAKQAIGKSFGGALNYNLKKVYSSDIKTKAELLATNFLSLAHSEIKKELEIMKALNPNLKRNTYHTSLNFSVDEKISNTKMEAIAKEYMEKMGFDNNPYFIFRHNDAEHPHCHILALRNRFDGTVVSDGNNYARSETIVRELENKYSLTKVHASKLSINKSPDKDELEMINRTGRVSDKMLMQEKVTNSLSSSKNIAEFINQLEKSNINPLFNQASTGGVSGITFISQNFKSRGQALGNQFKWGNISNKINYEQTRDSKAVSQANDRTREKYTIGTGTENANSQRSFPSTGRLHNKNELIRERPIQVDGVHKGQLNEEEYQGSKSSRVGSEFEENLRETEKSADDIENNFLFDNDYADNIKRNNNFNFNLNISDDEDDSKKRKKIKR
ncbi:relaxase/mobilization nuclease domain-containing protein [Pedobacter sandarakinus]|uniref:relaxase/mobilization nuclease domain-containing protein n=1 Tax=Pedobacter sandarakinus TaxID=353156 RepID=UPI0022486FBC|nr:relaxase/mobilization nuclease domain-containing protein [Pedobacter sandarakinus]MCX2575951.1 relaxase/mobilization nuclease domain-containing protein [Pedobacter sandarakinus]